MRNRKGDRETQRESEERRETLNANQEEGAAKEQTVL